FSGYRFIEVPSSSIIIRSFPPSTASATPSDEGIAHGKDTLERPLITIMLRYHEELNLSPNQVQNLETLRDEFQREAIRYDADIRIAELELQKLLRAESLDLEQVKPKLQEIEHLKSELRFARLRTIQQGKALLSPEQQNRLEALLGDSRYSRVEGKTFSPPTEN
ncbi:MAG TPA: periplasmic heavy metal sensor, partial [Candidatus Binatia bacterium]|nr:periplasmic heavy metal sensor [Candidatus Binatia bacterium]